MNELPLHPDQSFAQLCGLAPVERLGDTLLRYCSDRSTKLLPEVMQHVPTHEEYADLAVFHANSSLRSVASQTVDVEVLGEFMSSWDAVFHARTLDVTRTYIRVMATTMRERLLSGFNG